MPWGCLHVRLMGTEVRAGELIIQHVGSTREVRTMATMTREDVRAVLGPVEDSLAMQILNTGASLEELAEAHAWITNDEAPMNAVRPLASGRVNLLIDILEAAEDDVPGAEEP